MARDNGIYSLTVPYRIRELENKQMTQQQLILALSKLQDETNLASMLEALSEVQHLKAEQIISSNGGLDNDTSIWYNYRGDDIALMVKSSIQ